MLFKSKDSFISGIMEYFPLSVYLFSILYFRKSHWVCVGPSYSFIHAFLLSFATLRLHSGWFSRCIIQFIIPVIGWIWFQFLKILFILHNDFLFFLFPGFLSFIIVFFPSVNILLSKKCMFYSLACFNIYKSSGVISVLLCCWFWHSGLFPCILCPLVLSL